MKKKLAIVGAIVIIIGVALVLVMQMQPRKPDENTLIFEGDSKKGFIVDIAIQENDSILYIGSILLKDSKPTLGNVLQTINDSNEGVYISVDDDGNIVQINDTKDTNEHRWDIYIDNKKIEENSVKKIYVNENNGITLMYD